jgi:type II secretory pathway pseudopilin PulG
MTLVEVLIAIVLFAVVFGSIVTGLNVASSRANYIKHTAAAEKLAEQRLEQVLSAPWDTTTVPTVDEVIAANFPADTVSLSAAGLGPTVNATRTVNITPMPNASSPQYKVVQVRIVWSLGNRGPFEITLQGIKSPEQ